MHKRKASFKMAKASSSKQDDFGTFTTATMVDKRYTPVKQPSQVTHVMSKDISNIKSLDATPSTNVSQVANAANLHNLLSS